MQFPFSIAVALTLACTATATLQPAHSNTSGQKPAHSCPYTRKSPHVQEAECGYNTRTHDPQTFAVFIRNPSMDAYHGAPYGDCYAYTCEAPTEMVDDPRAHTFFWTKQGKDKHGTGTSCIKSPITGKCGCENSNGQFMPESDDCV